MFRPAALPSHCVGSWCLKLAAVVALVLSVAPASAQEGFGFRFGLGWQNPGGDLGEVLDGAVDGEFSLLIPFHFLRIGGGVNWSSLPMDAADASWSQIRYHGLIAVPYRVTDRLRPYVEGRYTYRTFRPEDGRFYGAERQELRDFTPSGGGFEGTLGLEVAVGRSTYLDLSGSVGQFTLSPDLSEEGLGPIDSGTSWRFQAGIAWFLAHDE